MTEYKPTYTIKVHHALSDFIENEVIPKSEIDSDRFWAGLSSLIETHTKHIVRCLDTRKRHEISMRDLFRQRPLPTPQAQLDYFSRSGFYESEVDDFSITPQHVDPEFTIPAPQLVVPLINARFALNAANGRWQSLKNILANSDIINNPSTNGSPETTNEKIYSFITTHLDKIAPLKGFKSHRDVKEYQIIDQQLIAVDKSGERTKLCEHTLFTGFDGSPGSPSKIVLEKNKLKLIIELQESSEMLINDVLVESATTVIMDCEDSVAAVDSEDKVKIYRNWLGLMNGTLQETVKRNGSEHTRKLVPDISIKDPSNLPITLKARSLMLLRTTGLHMTSPAILNSKGQEVCELLIDAYIATCISRTNETTITTFKNSENCATYLVCPKLHGSIEAQICNDIYTDIERYLGLPHLSIKVGMMDEEKRTSLNLKNCIYSFKDRIVFINTGFLDRTGDEIHTTSHAGPVVLKSQMKSSTWLKTYEERNVHTALRCGFLGTAQIGKGMWAQPDALRSLWEEKWEQIESGASTAWVPSPKAAAIHALHYHLYDAIEHQIAHLKRSPSSAQNLCHLPLANPDTLTKDEINFELRNNLQGILGYVVRWVHHGLGCSKVPDLMGIELMEDKATLRISCQHIANWSLHKVISEAQILEEFDHMAKLVDEQNQHTPGYIPLTSDGKASLAYKAAWALIKEASTTTNGYTEEVLHKFRKRAKSQD
ncbi:malate synthase G [uncultured Pseudoteredinibacter sp.]|uniref:malate synthase G n=1 Tax=uncultured Pseudoteredinibacter sp. TaxID=1641701 RepID=UPI0026160D40|nr:malate synthase G [uncultured Pseudoteredinibacter sp.]